MAISTKPLSGAGLLLSRSRSRCASAERDHKERERERERPAARRSLAVCDRASTRKRQSAAGQARRGQAAARARARHLHGGARAGAPRPPTPRAPRTGSATGPRRPPRDQPGGATATARPMQTPARHTAARPRCSPRVTWVMRERERGLLILKKQRAVGAPLIRPIPRCWRFGRVRTSPKTQGALRPTSSQSQQPKPPTRLLLRLRAAWRGVAWRCVPEPSSPVWLCAYVPLGLF